MAREECLKKEVTIKEDGRYLIYYDFIPERLVGKEEKQLKGEERK